MQSSRRWAWFDHENAPAAVGTAVIVKVTDCVTSRRPPPLRLCTATLFPKATASQSSPFEALPAPTARMVKLAGTSTSRHPSSESTSRFVAVRVNVVWTPVVAVSGPPVSVHSSSPNAGLAEATSATAERTGASHRQYTRVTGRRITEPSMAAAA